MEIYKFIVAGLVYFGSGALGCYLDVNGRLIPSMAWGLGVLGGGLSVAIVLA